MGNPNERHSHKNISNPVCIYQVSKSTGDTKPEAYTPQVVALGPYHHMLPKTYYMQKCKVNVALKAREKFDLLKFPELLNRQGEGARDIRGSCHDHLDIQDETLLYMMLIDGLFLLSLIDRKQPIDHNDHSSSTDNHDQFVDSLGRKYSLDAIIKDVVLLENQIPNIALKALFATRSIDKNNVYLIIVPIMYTMVQFCASLSPIELGGLYPHRDMVEPCHVLDALHQLVWLGKVNESPLHFGNFLFALPHVDATVPILDSDIKTWTDLWGLLPLINLGFVNIFILVVDLILKILNTLGISIPRDVFFKEEFFIPSASELAGIGVKFCSIKSVGESIRDISFKKETKNKNVVFILSLPILKFESNLTEVVMRYLLAYEAVAMPNSPKFARYVELMSGLVRTSSDVELLKKTGHVHIVPKEEDSGDVVKMFSSLKEVIGSKGKCEELDGTIDKVNEHYNNCRKVKMRKLVKKYLSISWKFFTVLAMILILFLLSMQTVCSIWSCPRIFHRE